MCIGATPASVKAVIGFYGVYDMAAQWEHDQITRPNDIWVSTRDSTLDPWSTPVSLGRTVNYPGYVTGAPALSWDGTTLYFYSDRPGGFGGRDLYVATRERSVDRWGKSSARKHEAQQ